MVTKGTWIEGENANYLIIKKDDTLINLGVVWLCSNCDDWHGKVLDHPELVFKKTTLKQAMDVTESVLADLFSDLKGLFDE